MKKQKTILLYCSLIGAGGALAAGLSLPAALVTGMIVGSAAMFLKVRATPAATAKTEGEPK